MINTKQRYKLLELMQGIEWRVKVRERERRGRERKNT